VVFPGSDAGSDAGSGGAVRARLRIPRVVSEITPAPTWVRPLRADTM